MERLHESAHGLTCKHHGGEVHEMGFLLILFMPAFFCNVSDAWLFAEKRKRLAVTLAGGFFEIFLWSLAVFTWRATVQDSLVNYLAWLVVSVSGVRVLFNMVPFIKLDGYYILSDLFDIPNLRQRALEGVADRRNRPGLRDAFHSHRVLVVTAAAVAGLVTANLAAARPRLRDPRWLGQSLSC